MGNLYVMKTVFLLIFSSLYAFGQVESDSLYKDRLEKKITYKYKIDSTLLDELSDSLQLDPSTISRIEMYNKDGTIKLVESRFSGDRVSIVDYNYVEGRLVSEVSRINDDSRKVRTDYEYLGDGGIKTIFQYKNGKLKTKYSEENKDGHINRSFYLNDAGDTTSMQVYTYTKEGALLTWTSYTNNNLKGSKHLIRNKDGLIVNDINFDESGEITTMNTTSIIESRSNSKVLLIETENKDKVVSLIRKYYYDERGNRIKTCYQDRRNSTSWNVTEYKYFYVD